jgi:hypothetical protein
MGIVKQSKFSFKIKLRELWEDHVAWTRNVIFCLIDELPGKDQAIARLLKNQDDIGNAVKPFYGEAAGNALAILLRYHINLAAELIIAAKEEKEEAYCILHERFHVNGRDIAKFLSDANSNLKLNKVQIMMCEHLELTVDEINARLCKDYNEDIEVSQRVHDEIRLMSDMIADGIIKQFPEKFE